MSRLRAIALVATVFACLAGLLHGGVVGAATLFDFEQRYFIEPDMNAADHTLIYAGDTYHLFYTVGNQGENWTQPGNLIDFGHATSPDLIHWTLEPRVLSIESPGWKERNLWSPHATQTPAGDYVLYYTGVNWPVSQQIGLATSSDLFNWTESPDNPVFRPDTTWALWGDNVWADCRDPFVFEQNGQLALVTTTDTKPGYNGNPTSLGALALATSDSLDNPGTFVDSGGPMFTNDTHLVITSPFISTDGTDWYLFYNEAGTAGIHTMTSADALSGYDKAGAQLFELEGFSCTVTDGPTNAWFGRTRDAIWKDQTILGIKFDELTWPGGPALGQPNTLLDAWTIVSGDAFEFQPTFGDRPQDRTSVPSEVEGHFWINTAEQHGGPLAWGCPSCGPDYARTGILRSQTMNVDTGIMTDYIKLRVGGGAMADSTYVALYTTASTTPVDVVTGDDSDVMQEAWFDIRALSGEDVYLEIADLATAGPFGYVSVDLIEATDEPPVAGIDLPEATPIRLARVMPISPTRAPVRIHMELPSQQEVTLAVHDVAGRLVQTLDFGRLQAGTHTVGWNGIDQRGARAPQGVYFVGLDGVPGVTGRLVLVR